MSQRKTQAERTELSDKKLLEAAKQLIIKRGTYKTTLKDIGEKAGYSRSLASLRFGSKEGLFRHITTTYVEKWISYTDKYSMGLTGLEAINGRIDAVKAFLENEPEEIRVVYTIWFESVSAQSSLHQQLEEFIRHGRERLMTVINEGIALGSISRDIDAQACSIVYMSHMFGLLYQWLVSPEDINWGSSLESLKGYCEFILKPAEEMAYE